MVWDADGRRVPGPLGGIAVERARPRPPGRGRGGVPAGRHARPLSQPVHARARRARWPSGCSRCSAADGRVFFGNSGAEANEAAFKLSPAHRALTRPWPLEIVAAERGFHGRTMGALALTGQPAKREPFAPLPGDVTYVPYGDVEALARGRRPTRTAMVILEPIQGEGGVRAAAGRLPGRRPRRPATRTGALLVLDEVQTGIGRTGALVRPPGRGRRARRGHPGQGARRRAADRRLRRPSAPPADLLAPGAHGTHLRRQPGRLRGGAGRAGHHRAPRACSTTSSAVGERLAAGIEALGHPLVAGVRGGGLLLGVGADRAGRRATWRPRPAATPASWSTPCSRT